MTQSFGQLIRQARKKKGYSQRELANELGIDFTYLSKLENDRANYSPKENKIRQLASHLELDAEELIFLSGRLPEGDEDFVKQHYKTMPTLFRRMRENPKFAHKIFQEAIKEEKRGQNADF
ncbi:helix-turn-helix transcriptional regulator [Crocosphaera sp. XPORK-15E]|uniref:helix-turn-helix domain-containing protein n=1 Tax=Crocosphaera sp. XPORK-15E TaxID=3110247 RepID=UPI002B1EFF65|nr:helix-turn-helix transcriptional regulator [Crocosphaera sp. XPORK-15E]MEA5533493.1 helix-turn-helix transcriptional regulator [Crocosphaera sp. XPORK-15E]